MFVLVYFCLFVLICVWLIFVYFKVILCFSGRNYNFKAFNFNLNCEKIRYVLDRLANLLVVANRFFSEVLEYILKYTGWKRHVAIGRACDSNSRILRSIDTHHQHYVDVRPSSELTLS